MRKLYLALLVAVVCGLLAAPGASAAPPSVRVLVNGEAVAAPAIVENGRVLMPSGAFLSSLGLNSRWFPGSRRLLAAGGSQRMWLQVDNHDGAGVHMDVPPRLVSDQVYVPVRAVSEALGGTVAWDGATRTVSVTVETPVAPMVSAAQFAPVVLVHGLNGDKLSWESASGTSLFAHLVTDLGLVEGRDLFRFEWDTTSAGATFAGAAPGLGATIDRALGDSLAAGYPNAQLTLIGHSAGGVLIRYWAVTDPDYREKVATVVTVGSPHQGATGAAQYGAQNGWPLAAWMEPDAQAKFNRDSPDGWLPGVTFVLVGHLQDELVAPRSALGHPETAALLDGLLAESAATPAAGFDTRQEQAVTVMLGHGWPGGAPTGDVHFGLIRENWRDWFNPVATAVLRPLTH